MHHHPSLAGDLLTSGFVSFSIIYFFMHAPYRCGPIPPSTFCRWCCIFSHMLLFDLTVFIWFYHHVALRLWVAPLLFGFRNYCFLLPSPFHCPVLLIRQRLLLWVFNICYIHFITLWYGWESLANRPREPGLPIGFLHSAFASPVARFKSWFTMVLCPFWVFHSMATLPTSGSSSLFLLL